MLIFEPGISIVGIFELIGFHWITIFCWEAILHPGFCPISFNSFNSLNVCNMLKFQFNFKGVVLFSVKMHVKLRELVVKKIHLLSILKTAKIEHFSSENNKRKEKEQRWTTWSAKNLMYKR